MIKKYILQAVTIGLMVSLPYTVITIVYSNFSKSAILENHQSFYTKKHRTSEEAQKYATEWSRKVLVEIGPSSFFELITVNGFWQHFLAELSKAFSIVFIGSLLIVYWNVKNKAT